MKIQIIGPYFTNYSLARMNRFLGINLKALGADVGIWCEDSEIDYKPNDIELEKCGYKDLVFLHQDPDVVIWNNFPKSISNKLGLDKLKGKIKLMYAAWEESIYPKHWVEEVNQNLDGVIVTSSFVKRIFENSGIELPIFVGHLGIDEIDSNKTYSLKSKKAFKILHVSTLKERKGGDILLKSYFSTFTQEDEVVLIIKTTQNPDNTIQNIISKISNSQKLPEVEIIIDNLSDEEMVSLHKSCSIEVYPSRAEGFGFPQLASLYFCNPLVVTGYSGYMDFVGDHNAFLIDYKIEKALKSDLGLIGSKWAEPNIEDTQKYLRYLYENRDSINKIKNLIKNGEIDKINLVNKDIGERIINGLQTARKLTWKNTAKTILDIATNYLKIKNIHYNFKNKNLGVVSTFADFSGISEYSQDIFTKLNKFFSKIVFFSNRDILERKFEDSKNVIRNWEISNSKVDDLIKDIELNKIEILHIQYHSGQMSIDFIKNLFDYLHKTEIEIHITLHNLSSNGLEIVNTLKFTKNLKKIYVHSSKDVDFLNKIIGLKNIAQLYIPTIEPYFRPKNPLKKVFNLENKYPIICTHGLLNINKNIPKVIESISILKRKYNNVMLILMNAISKENIFANSLNLEIQNLILEYKLEDNIIKIEKFLNEAEILNLMSICDAAIYAYSEVGESASGAINKAFSSNTISITSDIPTFKEYTEEVFKISNIEPITIADCIEKILLNSNLRAKILDSAKLRVFSKMNKDTVALKLMQEYLS